VSLLCLLTVFGKGVSLVMLIRSSEEAIEKFIAHCDVAPRGDLLMPYELRK
jgi:hypothetical protein